MRLPLKGMYIWSRVEEKEGKKRGRKEGRKTDKEGKERRGMPKHKHLGREQASEGI